MDLTRISRRTLIALCAGLSLAVSPGRAQEVERVDPADQNLDVTMTLLPEGATRPDAVTRVIELPAAVRARAAGAINRSGSLDPEIAGGAPDRLYIGGRSADEALERRAAARDAADRNDESLPRTGDGGRELAGVVSEPGREAAEDALDAAPEAAEGARDTGRDAADTARDSGRDAVDSARDNGREEAERARDLRRGMVEQAQENRENVGRGRPN